MIACLTVPYFATAVERRKDLSSVEKLSHPGPGSGSLPGLVIGGQPWEPQPLYAFSQEVAKNGVRPGMSLRLAHVLSPQAEFISTNLPHYFSAHGEITDILTDFTNLVERQRYPEGRSLTGRAPHDDQRTAVLAQVATGLGQPGAAGRFA